jgi:hypothetical protein
METGDTNANCVGDTFSLLLSLEKQSVVLPVL